MKLGKQTFRFDARTLRMKDYVAKTYTPPPYVSYTYGITNWGMMLNDVLGDCTVAACGHALQVWTKDKVIIPDSMILSYYEKWCGYIRGDASTDRGGVELDILNDWRRQTLGGHVLRGYVDPQPQNLTHVMHSIAEFGGVYIGLQVPNSALEQNAKGQVWDVVPDDGGIAGGHAVFCPAYHTLDPYVNKRTTINCITWGGVQKMTVDFWDKYCDESHCLLGAAWQPAGFNLAQFEADLAGLNG